MDKLRNISNLISHYERSKEVDLDTTIRHLLDNINIFEISIGILNQQEKIYDIKIYNKTYGKDETTINKDDVSDWNEQLLNKEFLEESDEELKSIIYGEIEYEHLKYFVQFIYDTNIELELEDLLCLEMIKRFLFSYLRKIEYNQLSLKEDIDTLTGIYKRQVLVKNSEERIKLGKPFSIIRIKLSGVKKINNIFGVTAGDEMIKRFVLRIKNINDTVMYKIDGVEFIIITSVDKEEYILKRIMESIEKPIRYLSHLLKIDARIGIVRFPEHGKTVEELDFSSGIALEHSKILGFNKVGKFSEELKEKRTHKTKISDDLKDALINNELEVYYQAQICLKSKKPIGLEALIRWYKDGKYTSPVDFIPIAEENGMILEIGYFVFEEACKYQKELENLGYNISVAVNISVRQLFDEDFIEKINMIVEKIGVNTSKIDLEITESMDIGIDQVLTNKIDFLKTLGFSIVMDDFGTGYSSLGYLREKRFDKLKIDREFVKNLKTELERDTDEILLLSMIDLAKVVGMLVVVEGVETYEQIQFLENTNCNIVQGFIYSKPSSKKMMTEYLKLNL